MYIYYVYMMKCIVIIINKKQYSTASKWPKTVGIELFAARHYGNIAALNLGIDGIYAWP